VTTEEASIGFRVGGGEDLAWEDEVVDDGLHGFMKLMAGQLVDSTRHRFLAGAIEIKNETIAFRTFGLRLWPVMC
jgi:hypothetical protein